MDLPALRASLAAAGPPEGLDPSLAALWHAAKGNWNGAHALVQDEEGQAAAWVHAYLHRVEGDLSNAGYWYRRSGHPVATGPVDDEWASIAGALLIRQ